MNDKTLRNVARIGAIILLSVYLGYVIGTGSAIVVSESIVINGSGSLLTMSTLPQARDHATGIGPQTYARELEVDENGNSMMSTYYRLDGQPYFHNRYYISANNKNVSINNNDVGIQHSVNVYNMKNIETENFIECDSGAFRTDFGMTGTGNLEASVFVAEGHHYVDVVRTYAGSDFEYLSSVMEMAPPAGGGDWLSCDQLGEGPWSMWLEDDVDVTVFDVDEDGEGCYVE